MDRRKFLELFSVVGGAASIAAVEACDSKQFEKDILIQIATEYGLSKENAVELSERFFTEIKPNQIYNIGIQSLAVIASAKMLSCDTERSSVAKVYEDIGFANHLMHK